MNGLCAVAWALYCGGIGSGTVRRCKLYSLRSYVALQAVWPDRVTKGGALQVATD